MERILVTGGTRSGKSAYAESRLAGRPDVVYVATGPVAGDADWQDRLAAHRARRPATWDLAELDGTPADTLAGLLTCSGPPLLVDSLGLWLTARLDESGLFTPTASPRSPLPAVEELVSAWSGAARPVVAVTEEVGWGVHPATRSGRLFADRLGELNARLARAGDEVWLVACGMPLRLDGPGSACVPTYPSSPAAADR